MTGLIFEPDWNILINFGLPLNPARETDIFPDYDDVVHQITVAARFFYWHGVEPHNGRAYDSFRALLLALKIHYPSEFFRIEQIADMDFVKLFKLETVSGRDIKLRNLSLPMISRYFRESGIFKDQ